ncbi:biotin/lipoyl-binding protein [Sporomusa malonica]|uniref:Biotin-lipoyl like n=1 Tax=Sporomusa malonica TaxID=112901 RepID=A0A1W1YFY7_9FIRM|nr:biotin/lipoyl-binding protein [Sporomusa malonica]SMC35130.1 Biotin-lipoyl like [Sporomusa malonica]
MDIKGSKKLYVGLIFVVALFGIVVIRSGMLSKTQISNANQAVAVKAMQVVTRDTPINSEFVGQVKAKSEVKVMSKVSGNVVAKMANGGDNVYKGQPLFQIDNKQYRSAINSARATLNKSQAYRNSKCSARG